MDSPSIKGFQVSWSEFGLSFSLEPGWLARELASVLPSCVPLEDREARVSYIGSSLHKYLNVRLLFHPMFISFSI